MPAGDSYASAALVGRAEPELQQSLMSKGRIA